MIAGNILTSSITMDDPVFSNSVILIAEYNERGALGFIVNQLFERPLNHLVAYNNSPEFPLYVGGPVDEEHLYFVHQRNDVVYGGTLITDNVYLGGDFAQAIYNINNGTLTQADIKIFVGHCGWNTGELEKEITDGYWHMANYSNALVFSKNI